MFRDRADAGAQLAVALSRFHGEDVVVLGLPRGGVPVAAVVAEALDAPLDVIIVRKLGLPYQPELAMGAVGEDGVRVVNEDVVRVGGVSPGQFQAVESAERDELDVRAQRLRRGHTRLPLAGRTAIVVDDGVATGATARAACQVARAHGAARVVLAVPIGAPDTIEDLRADADEVVCVDVPARFGAVGQGYRDFSQVSDPEVADLLYAARARLPVDGRVSREGVGPRDEDVEIQAGSIRLDGRLTLPEDPVGLVVFAHGSGSSRHSPRNRHIARVLNDSGLGTLLFDLLTPREEPDRSLVFDIELLADRLVEVTGWLRSQPGCERLPIGYFGASTGAGAALWAAADPRADVAAVVSRGGRPDLAASRLARVHVPTLLVVGGSDDVVLDLNRRSQSLLAGPSDLAVVPGATHLFEEPGTLDEVARLARDWFVAHLAHTSRPVR